MKKIYETNSYCREIDTKIESFWEEQDSYYVMFEETIFFPEEGGQYADTGYFLTEQEEKVCVLDGVMKDGKVYHKVDRAVEAGQKVHCVLDWDKRYMRMQNHTGEHILTGAIHNRYGFDNVGFHLSDEGEVTMDMDGAMTVEQVYEMETLANQLIYENLPIYDKYPGKEELANLAYRSKIEIEGQVRLIQIGEEEKVHDLCACCAPHVRSTAEVGIIKVTSVTKYKGGVRIGILCGLRALLYCRKQIDALSEVAAFLSTKPENVMSLVEGMKVEIGELKGKIGELNDEIVLGKVKECNEEPCIFLPGDVSAATLKNAFNTMAETFYGFVGVFAGDEEQGYRYNAGSRDLDSRELAAAMREQLDAKGGGNQEMIQGKVAKTMEEVKAFWKTL